jgi:transcriptional regulator with XRE-family HTH domain
METERGDTGAPGDTRGFSAARRSELAAFLRARRAEVGPCDVGLPDGDRSRRRTPGLRREEVAQLARVSLTWYTWLEQGRPISASAQVVDALARALLLDPDQHHQLRALAGLPLPVPETAADEVRPRLQRLVDAAAPNIASIYDMHFDYLAWNRPYVLLRNDPAALPDDRRNLLWMMFTDAENRARMPRWEPAARALIGQFRAAVGQRPGDPRFAELVAALGEASPDFSAWWADYPVRHFRPTTIPLDHPAVGRIELEVFQLNPVEHPDLRLVLQIPAGSFDRDRLASLLS